MYFRVKRTKFKRDCTKGYGNMRNFFFKFKFKGLLNFDHLFQIPQHFFKFSTI